VRTGPDGKAVLEFEDGSVVRLDPLSDLTIDNFAVQRQEGKIVARIARVSFTDGDLGFDIKSFPSTQSAFQFVSGGDTAVITGTTGIISRRTPPPGAPPTQMVFRISIAQATGPVIVARITADASGAPVVSFFVFGHLGHLLRR
jgi:hypothetical protein